MTFRKLTLVCILCSLLIFSFVQCNQTSSEANAQETVAVNSASEEVENAVLVETVQLEPRTMRSFILLNATVETENMVDIYPQATGIITDLKVEEGKRVKKGTVLLQLDDRVQAIAEQRARVNFKKKEQEHARVMQSFEKKLISEAELENSKFELESAELAWKEAQLNLSYTRVESPINGVVAERHIEEGDHVQPATKLFNIVDTSEKIARVFIPEKEISSVKHGQETILVSEFLDDARFKGTIKRISPVIDPNSGTFKVTVGIDDNNSKLRPGMFVSVRIITAVHDDVIAVPKDALVYDSGLPFVYVVRENKARKIPLQQGFSDEMYIESLGGLEKGDKIIIVGQSGLKDNTAVKEIQIPGN